MKFLGALIISIIFWSCEKDHDNNCTGAKSSFTWQKDRSLHEAATLIEGDTMNFITIHSGSDLLFTWQYDGEECRDREDDDYTRYLRFVVPEGATTFSYTDTELRNCSAHYTVSGWWVNSGATAISKGTISGTRLNSLQWKINFDIELGEGISAEQVVFEKTFVLK